jgi:hypothetical protein
MRRFPAHRGLVVVLLASGSLVACSSGDPSSPPTTMHPGTAATSTATPSSNPTEAAAAAAIAAVRKLYADFKAMTSSGSTADYRRDFTPDCQVCLTDARFIDKLTKQQERLSAEGFTITRLFVVWNKPNVVVVQGYLSHPGFRIVRGDVTVRRIPALRPTEFLWHVAPRAGGWKIESAEAVH